MANTLYEYYTQQGKALPSVSERSKLYGQYGLGSGYSGTAQQNTSLLARLKGGQSAPAPSPGASPGSTSAYTTAGVMGSNQGTIDNAYSDLLKTYQDYQGTLSDQFGAQRDYLKSQVPLIQQRYSDMLKDITAQGEEAQKGIQEQGNQAVQKSEAVAGARGLYGSGVEMAQQANIGATTAGLVKSQADATQRAKERAVTYQAEEVNKVQGLIVQLAGEESEAGFKLRQLIAQVGPDKLDMAVKMASQQAAENRANRDYELDMAKFNFQKAEAAKETASEKTKKQWEKMKEDVDNGLTLAALIRKYKGDIDETEVFYAYNLKNTTDAEGNKSGYGKYGETEQQLLDLGIKRSVYDTNDDDLSKSDKIEVNIEDFKNNRPLTYPAEGLGNYKK